ncbi:sensor histidine kinase [Bosea sp. NPDC003192]|uniref:sensor histidine kinase n=1 Tax=Bosea sp. NPDC003192 TaxID=3390551 RepID=UPI003D06836D
MKRPIQPMNRHFHGRAVAASWQAAIGKECDWMTAPAGYRGHADRSALASADGMAGSSSSAPVSFWRANAAAWSFIAFFGLISRLVAFNDVTLAVTLTLVLDPIGFVLTAAAYKFYLERTNHGGTAIAIWALACAVPGGLLQMAISKAVKDGLFPDIPDGNIAVNDAVPAIFYTAVFLGWSLAYFWIRADVDARSERMRRSEAQAAATRAELQRLRLQLDPHFLFNALNTVAVEIPENPEAALEMTLRIAAYLRYSLDQQTRPVCPLSDEIEAVRAFIRIQELRFEGRLRCTVEMDPAVRAVPVPHLLVQGLVENALKHGLRSSVETLVIRLTARRMTDDAVVIEVVNPGRLAPHAGDRPALGLANARRRLELHYPSRHELSLTQDGDVIVARLLLRGNACFA